MLTSVVAALALQSAQPEVRPTFWLDVDPRPALPEQLGPTSYFAGAPFLPADETWPRHDNGEAYTFLGQINLSERPALDDDPLPDDGLLLFFGYQRFFGANIMTTVTYVPSENLPRSPHRDLSTAPQVVATWLERGEEQIPFAYPITIYADQSFIWIEPQETFDYALDTRLSEEEAERRRQLVADHKGLSLSPTLPVSQGFRSPPGAAVWLDIKRALRHMEHDRRVMECFLGHEGELAERVQAEFLHARSVLYDIISRWLYSHGSSDWAPLPPNIADAFYRDQDRVRSLRYRLIPLHMDLEFSQRPEAIEVFGQACVDEVFRYEFDRSSEAARYSLRQAIVEGRDARGLYSDLAVMAIAPTAQERIRDLSWFYPRSQMLGFGWSLQTGPFDNLDNVLLLQIDGVHHPMIGAQGCVLHFWITPTDLASRRFDQTFSTWECD